MRRRDFISLLGGATVAGPLIARAQQPTLPMIGFVRSSSLYDVGDLVAAFRHGLKETGYIEGQNVVIEFRSADDRYEKLPTIIAELIRRQAAVLVVNAVSAEAAKAATTTVPIVFATGGDPVRDKLVASFNRPGGNITGVTFFTTVLGPKQFELIRSLVPKAMTIGVLANRNDQTGQLEVKDVVAVAHAGGMRVIVVNASSEHDFETAFATIAQERADALLVIGDATFYSGRHKLIAMAARYAIPAIYSLRDFVAAGGLMSYGASIIDAYRQVGTYTGRILKGEKSADLPVQQPTKFELIINLKTANALGITMPQSLLLRADEVIQ